MPYLFQFVQSKFLNILTTPYLIGSVQFVLMLLKPLLNNLYMTMM